MKRGLDTNVLVYAHLPAMDEHAAVRAFLLGQLADDQVPLVVTPSILHELVHVVTDARRFDPPLAMAEATALARTYLGRTNVECVATDEAATRRALALVDQHRLGRKRLADTLFAATLLRHGVREVITCNTADFTAFDEITAIDPRA